jgi:3-hydroxybutyryl-CoA dehydrogenase
MAEIHTVAVIGAGPPGRGIACAAALGGYRTILEDILPASLRKAESEIRGALDEAIHTGKLSAAEADAALLRLEYASSVEEAARQADLVIEAVPDEWESKSEIFILLDKICKPETILVSNTLSLSVSEIASVTYRPGKIVGMRFGTAGQKWDAIEIFRGAQTDDETVTECVELAQKMGKQVVVSDNADYSDDRDPSLRSG